MKRIWQIFSSIKTAIVLFFLIALTSIIGTLIKQQPTPEGYERIYGATLGKLIKLFELYDMYHSWWFQLLLILFAINLVVCSIDRLPNILRFFKKENRVKELSFFSTLPERCRSRTKLSPEEALNKTEKILKKYGFKPKEKIKKERYYYVFAEKGLINRLGVYATHFSILLVLIGGLIGSISGFTGYMTIVEGEGSRNVVLRKGELLILPFEIKCKDFKIVFYKNRPNVPKDYISEVEVIENGKKVKLAKIEVNHPLKYKNIYFYQSSYGVYSTQEGTLTLLIRDKETGKEYNISLKVGEKKKIKGLDDIEIKLIAFYPDFVLDENNQPTTRSMELRNPAALLEVYKNEKPIYRTWVFALFPNVHSKKDVKLSFLYKSFEPTFYTVLQVSKDPGVWLVWTGCTLMIISILITFFLSHRRIFLWVEDKDGKAEVYLAFSTNRNKESFKKTVEEICNKIKEELK